MARSRARRGPSDEGMRLAKMVAKWQPAGRRMGTTEKLEWREASLRRVLADHGVPYRAALREVLVDAAMREERRSNHARYVRAYGSGRDAGRGKKRRAKRKAKVRVKSYKVKSYSRKRPAKRRGR